MVDGLQLSIRRQAWITLLIPIISPDFYWLEVDENVSAKAAGKNWPHVITCSQTDVVDQTAMLQLYVWIPNFVVKSFEWQFGILQMAILCVCASIKHARSKPDKVVCGADKEPPWYTKGLLWQNSFWTDVYMNKSADVNLLVFMFLIRGNYPSNHSVGDLHALIRQTNFLSLQRPEEWAELIEIMS